MMAVLLWLALTVAKGPPARADGAQPGPEPGVEVSGPEVQADGTRHYRVRSPYQAEPTQVRILLPEKLEPPARRRVLFVLPVDPGLQCRWGDGLATARKLDVANRHGFVVVAPTFADWPWYADHPTEAALRQESHLLRVVVPLVERLHPHEAGRRALVGFSKSGWGAFSLLLRHPKAFGAACAWDAPMMMAEPRFEMGRIAGTRENFELYRVARLLRERAASVRGARRLGLFGYGIFRDDTRRAHELLTELGIPHAYADGPHRRHRWDSGWFDEAVTALRAMLP